jgi:hypothetical protein
MTVVRLLQSDCGPPLYSSADLVSALLAAASQPPRISSTGTTLPTLRAQGPARDLRPATTATGGTGREPRMTLRCRQKRARKRPCRRRTTTTTCPSGAAITERCVLLGWPLATGRRCLLLTSGTLSLFSAEAEQHVSEHGLDEPQLADGRQPQASRPRRPRPRLLVQGWALFLPRPLDVSDTPLPAALAYMPAGRRWAPPPFPIFRHLLATRLYSLARCSPLATPCNLFSDDPAASEIAPCRSFDSPSLIASELARPQESTHLQGIWQHQARKA